MPTCPKPTPAPASNCPPCAGDQLSGTGWRLAICQLPAPSAGSRTPACNCSSVARQREAASVAWGVLRPPLAARRRSSWRSPCCTRPLAASWAPASAGTWQIDTRINGINPARVHTQMAAFPLDGTAKVTGEGADIGFDVALQARPTRVAAPARKGESASEALARDLRALRLRDATTTGRWADGLLTLTTLRVRTDDAELAGNAQLRPDAPGGRVDLTLNAPGTSVAVKGELQPASGAGTLRASIQDAARTLAWAQKLPGGADALAGARARGSATLEGDVGAFARDLGSASDSGGLAAASALGR